MRKTAFVTAEVMTAVCAILLAAPITVNAQGIAHIGAYDSLGFPACVVVQGDYAYVGDHILDLVIMNISNPAAPYVEGRYAIPSAMWIFDLDIYGDTVYLATGNSEPYEGALYIIDVTNKAVPYLLGSITFYWEATVVEVSISPSNNQDYAYVATVGGNAIIDVSNPASPVEVVALPVPNIADMKRMGSYLYVAAGSDGLEILDVSNATNPFLVGELDTPGIAVGVAHRRDQSAYTYIADRDSGLQVIQTTAPAAPVQVGHLATSDQLTDIAAGDYFIFAALEDSGIAVIQAGNPGNPRIFASSPVPYRIQGIALGNGIIITAWDERIDTYRLDPIGCNYIPGDINGNGQFNGIDIVFAVSFLKGGSAPPSAGDCNPPCTSLSDPFYAAMDVNGNCQVNGIDITFLIAYIKGLQPEIRFCPICPPND